MTEVFKLVVNCEAQAVMALLEEAAAWDAKGEVERAKRVREEAAAALAASGIADPYEEAQMLVPLTAEEMEQHQKDLAEYAQAEKRREAEETARKALLARLKSGQASLEEVQQALASLL